MKGKSISDLRRKFNARLKAEGEAVFYAMIKGVDKETRTCSVEANGATYDDVLLYAVADEGLKGLVVIPKKGSTVLVGRIGGSNELYVAMFSEVDAVLLTVGDTVEAMIDDKELSYKNDQATVRITENGVEIDAEKIVFNGGDNQGLVKVEELKKNLDQLKQFVEAMHGALPSAFSAVGAAMAANGALGNTAYTGAMTGKTIVLGDMANEKVTH